jgi:hypothetical protein
MLDFYLLQLKSKKKLVLIGLFIFLHLQDHVFPLTDKKNSNQNPSVTNTFLFQKSHIDISSKRY